MAGTTGGTHGETTDGISGEANAEPAAEFQDGNALAGPLSEVFAADITVATVRCTACGLAGPLATLRVYSRAPGAVARCPGCEHVMLRLVRTEDSAWLDLRGTVSLRLPLGAPAQD